MQICQNPNCSNPFNPDGNKFCLTCGHSNFSNLLVNRYRVLSLLGEGGFGKTYAAQDITRFDDPCVIKQFFPQVQGTAALAKAAELFKQEAKRLYELGENHSQIPRLMAYFEQGSSLYLVQEFIQGQTLLTELRQQTFTEEHIRQVLADLLPILQFIHDRNVIHRDIKPENIMRRQSDGKLVLIDFGGAKQVTQTSLARQATGIFTVGYAPSEQMSGFASPASDLYALGATCARLLTQCLAGQDASGNLFDRLYDVYNAQWLWRDISQEKGISVSDNLGQILDKLLKHLPRERYQSAAEVLQDLNNTKAKTTILSVPQPPSSPVQPLSQPQFLPVQAHQTNKGLILQTIEFDIVTVDAGGTKASRKSHNANLFVEKLGNFLTLEMVQIPGGICLIGSPLGEGSLNEKPQHQVTIPGFFIGQYEITQAQYQAIMGNNPSTFKDEKRPVERVSWYDAVEFCKKLSQKTGRTYRLPSEAEWEYACRAGTTTSFHFGGTISTALANYNGNFTYAFGAIGKYRQETTPVGSFPPNSFGLYDMHGNVWEWCQDNWHNNYNGAPTDGSAWLISGNNNCLLRGGSWDGKPGICRSAFRDWVEADYCASVIGFRVVLE
ncbi:bifunctional serine/threonine-protein kinase/formylglycine-generating enzyme family protein [Nostoc sp. UHCC 0870]|uniref:bifunctional serine/threonine-protein kinase/formylglycine-generating enzyme family protein n=1 Tax=Nostoc sp. UHCC 0870 TaxID=2914041 RepID=UPI001EDE9D72|nr:bifunctional serine/threonine-protein kinase/formylglycine-generating enzyme family protein [Nostoc sp. UHCC 0870]UKO97075.1 bifunctional serine/threonine-protein kinase/formylglycine-generating enzyme family protein [Nostoc sp. UHCC 0870]